jgi:hypothetical protein
VRESEPAPAAVSSAIVESHASRILPVSAQSVSLFDGAPHMLVVVASPNGLAHASGAPLHLLNSTFRI